MSQDGELVKNESQRAYLAVQNFLDLHKAIYILPHKLASEDLLLVDPKNLQACYDHFSYTPEQMGERKCKDSMNYYFTSEEYGKTWAINPEHFKLTNAQLELIDICLNHSREDEYLKPEGFSILDDGSAVVAFKTRTKDSKNKVEVKRFYRNGEIFSLI